MTTKARLFLVLPLLLVLVVGCTSTKANPVKVSGKVTYKGAPVPGGTIQFTKEGGGFASCPLSKDGSYSASDLPVGEYAVAVETESANTGAHPAVGSYGKGKGGMSPGPGGAPPAPPSAGDYVKIPAKYKKKETSGLKVSLAAGDNPDKNFDLAD
jgi:hypothetical protein